MKANELMIGDWVCYDGDTEYENPIKVDGLTTDDISLDGEGFLGGIEGMVVPIPLTAEILEKNGWEHAYEKNALGELHKWHKEVRFQQFTVWKNKGRFELGNLGNHPFRFVHELQHALRLCGLNDLVDNFKV